MHATKIKPMPIVSIGYASVSKDGCFYLRSDGYMMWIDRFGDALIEPFDPWKAGLFVQKKCTQWLICVK